MKKLQRNFFSNALAMAATGLVGALIAISACAQAPTQTPPPSDRPGGDRPNRGERGDRGDRQRGEQGDRGALQGRGAFGGRGGLGLDEKQMDLYREASEANRDALTKLDEKLRTAQKELLQAVIAEKYDEAVVSAKADAVAKIQTEITLLRAKAFSTIAPTLKPEQREQLENSRMGAAILTGGGMGGLGGASGPAFGPGPGGPGPGGPGGDGGRAFRGRDGQPGQTGGENTGDRGPRRARPPQ